MKKMGIGLTVIVCLALIIGWVTAVGQMMLNITNEWFGMSIAPSSFTAVFIIGILWIGTVALSAVLCYGIGDFIEKRLRS